MGIFIALLSLIITIMSLNISRIELGVRFLLMIIFASYVYKISFGDYNVWWDDKYFTSENMRFYLSNTLPKCIVCMGITYFLFFILFRFTIRFFIDKYVFKIFNRYTNKYKNRIGEDNYKAKMKDNIVKGVSYLSNSPITPNYKMMLSFVTKDICNIVLVVSVWIIVYGINWVYFICILLAGLICIILSILAVSMKINEDLIKTTINESTRNIQ